ncbi:major facilitator superfamily transporter [Fusarium sp. NRRL 52700]|nr:major facilitator superfamily transporter [Fusarium sp. NRRL 52700]
MKFPPTFVEPFKWPEVILTARSFSSKHSTTRFALLRLWSAPHYYPFMVGMFNRRNTSFPDSRGRSWKWKFVPKDMPGSEFSTHHTTRKRLDVLKDKLGDRMKFTYHIFLPVLLLATSSYAGYCGPNAKVYYVDSPPNWHEDALYCDNGYGDVECPYGTAAHIQKQQYPVVETDKCATWYTCCR